LEWGSDEDGDEDAEEEEGGMDVDSDLDALAMARFARGMGPEGGRWVTMDDVRDGERMRAEDEDGGGGEGSSASESDGEDEDDDEVEAIVDAEEALMIAEPRDLNEDKSDEEDEDEDEDDDSDDDDDDDPNRSPKSGFQARLERLRKAARERGPDDSLELMELEFSDEEDDYDEFLDRNRNRNRTWAEKDENFRAEIHVNSLPYASSSTHTDLFGRRYWTTTATFFLRARGRGERSCSKPSQAGRLSSLMGSRRQLVSVYASLFPLC
jgi:hypothetical protein